MSNQEYRYLINHESCNCCFQSPTPSQLLPKHRPPRDLKIPLGPSFLIVDPKGKKGHPTSELSSYLPATEIPASYRVTFQRRISVEVTDNTTPARSKQQALHNVRVTETHPPPTAEVPACAESQRQAGTCLFGHHVLCALMLGISGLYHSRMRPGRASPTSMHGRAAAAGAA